MFKHSPLLLGLSATLVLLQTANAAMPEPDVAINTQGLHLVLNIPQTRLFLYRDGKLFKDYPVAVGKMLTKTPMGEFDISGIYKNPTWNVPKSIQEEMKRAGKPVQTSVPPGPANPLGPVFIRFGESKLGVGFHGTNAPSSVPGVRSHGCVRLKSPDALELAKTVQRGDAVTVAYQTVILNQDQSGQLWLSAYPNPYKQKETFLPKLAQRLLDWQQETAQVLYGKRVDDALKSRNGKPVCLSCQNLKTAKISGDLVRVAWLSDAVVPVAPVVTPLEESEINVDSSEAW